MSKWQPSQLEKNALSIFWTWKENEIGHDPMTKVRNNILTELYNSGELQEKVKGMCYRNKIAIDTKINEDVIQEAFLKSKKIFS